ncbi:MAG TPA: choice-of-anchor D domain-containing protein [Candidatus Krumholzibacteria bacterium]|nr:choice-of-anchor D domain-containing protein [Candidatus Krumholzibacteria bacterium]
MNALACSDMGDPYVYQSDCDRSTGGIAFGTVEVGFFSERGFTIFNSGNADLTGNIVLADPSFTIVSGDGEFVVPPQQSHDVMVRFAPADTGMHTADIDLGDGCPPVRLSGTGGFPSGGPRCLVDPPALAFGTVAPGTFSERVLEIRNVGLVDFAADITSPCAATFAVVAGGGPAVVAPGDTLRVRVRFSPPMPGPFQCTLATGVDCGDIAMTGAGQNPATVSFAADIKPIFLNRCEVCHNRFGQAGLDLRSSFSHASLVGVTSSGYAPALRVKPGNPDLSVLYHKVAGDGQFGQRMPPVGQGVAVPPAELEKIRIWITEGALNN